MGVDYGRRRELDEELRRSGAVLPRYEELDLEGLGVDEDEIGDGDEKVRGSDRRTDNNASAGKSEKNQARQKGREQDDFEGEDQGDGEGDQLPRYSRYDERPSPG